MPMSGRDFLRRCMLALFLTLCALALWLGAGEGDHCVLPLVGALGLFALSCRLGKLLRDKPFPFSRLQSWALLTAVCLVGKGLWILLVRVPVEGDYSVFWGYARQMSQWGMVYGGRYMTLFPHIYGYASFLSGCMRAFGTGPLVAQGVNLALTLLTGSCLFWLLRGNLWGAGFVYLLWIACPSQGLYNTLVLSEPLYTALIAVAFCLIKAQKAVKRDAKWCILWGIVLGALLGWLDMLRPVAAILIIALLLWRGLLAERDGRGRIWTACLAVMICAYTLTGAAADRQVERMAGEPPAGMPGYNVLVGLNQSSGGCWNQEDSEALSLASERADSTARGVQKEMLELAKSRALSGEINYPVLLRDKLAVLLGRDDACVGYCAAGLPHIIRFQVLCNGFWYYILLLALLGGVGMWRRERSHMLLAPLYVLGLTVAQLLVEVAGRYHYSMIPMLLLVGAYGLFPPEDRDTNETERVG